METKNIINIPEGFEIDKEQSNDRRIVLRKIEDRVKSWEEYCEKMKDKDSYYFNEVVYEIKPSKFRVNPILSEFVDKKDVEALVAFCKLRKMRKQWIGEWEPDWTDEKQDKYVVYAKLNELTYGIRNIVSAPLSFPTYQVCTEFLETFKDLLEQAKSLL